MVTEADWRHWKPEDIVPYMDVAFEAFGPQRLMIGSDWPVCTVAASYARPWGWLRITSAVFRRKRSRRFWEGTRSDFGS